MPSLKVEMATCNFWAWYYNKVGVVDPILLIYNLLPEPILANIIL